MMHLNEGFFCACSFTAHQEIHPAVSAWHSQMYSGKQVVVLNLLWPYLTN